MNTTLKNRIYDLLETMEASMPMAFAPPVTDMKRLSGLPESLFTLYTITDGMEINIPGTVILPAGEISEWPETPDAGDSRLICFGHMNFGDLLCADRDGRIIQISIEDGAEFLRWESLTDYLEYEYESGVADVHEP